METLYDFSFSAMKVIQFTSKTQCLLCLSESKMSNVSCFTSKQKSSDFVKQ